MSPGDRMRLCDHPDIRILGTDQTPGSLPIYYGKCLVCAQRGYLPNWNAPIVEQDPTGKICAACNQLLSEGSYHKRSASPDGLAPYCRKCTRFTRAGLSISDIRRLRVPA